jgi:diacylglycerol O-acyltransferase
VGLAGLEGDAFCFRVIGLVEQPGDPGCVRRARGHAVDPDAFADMVGRHGLGQSQNSPLGRAVQGPLGESDAGGDRARVDDGGMLRAAQGGQAGARDANDPEHVDLQNVPPLIVVIVLHRALRTDAGVVDEEVEVAKMGEGGGDGAADRAVVAHVGGEPGQPFVGGRGEVEHGHGGPAVGEQLGGGQADAGRSARHDAGEALQLGFVHGGQRYQPAAIRRGVVTSSDGERPRRLVSAAADGRAPADVRPGPVGTFPGNDAVASGEYLDERPGRRRKQVVAVGLMPITDAIFLWPERSAQPMHVGALQLFSLPAGAGADWVPRFYERMLETTEAAELFRRRPERSLRTLGAWTWTLDDDIDLQHHVRRSALPRPGRVRELLALASRLHGTLLDRQRPLWEMQVIEGLEGNRFAIYTKMHHALADGVSALRLLTSSLAGEPGVDVAPLWAEHPRPPRGPGPGVGATAGSAWRAAGDLVDLVPILGWRALQNLVAETSPTSAVAPPTMLNVPITGSRRYAAQSWPLDHIKAVAKRSGATVNDIVLAMCSSALRSYLQSFDDLPESSLIAMSPVSLRAADDGAPVGGNAVGTILASLGTDRADPADRLEVVKASMAAGKANLAGLSSLQVTALSALMMAPAAVSAMGTVGRFVPPPFNLVISNLVGPSSTLYYDGATLEGLYPLSIPLDGQALNITVTSYRNSLDFGLTGDRQALPHLQRLLGYLDTGLAELSALVGL